MATLLLTVSPLFAHDDPLEISTQSQVTREGKVSLTLTLRNTGPVALSQIHPMFHFHHTMDSMETISRLDPGQSVTLENKNHPPVKRVGSYPVLAMVRYQKSPDAPDTITRIHTHSFYYQSPMVSLIEGRIGTSVNEKSSMIRVLLKNPSPSFKDIRMTLLLPPELKAKGFERIKGVTIPSGEQKYFEVPVQKVAGTRNGVFPIHLLIEYGEVVRHYSGEIQGQIYFGPGKGEIFQPQLLVFLFLAVMMFQVLQKRFKWLRNP
ncbi:MAG: hypothetical protein GWM98_17640 [Nitrospinaceae bacterium]|nr:hypothetical protein [Nitrospinaceae bacterium]NIR55972.1 hypothetical protein [Nitrospinaceae bacterium]NIT83253.1 hypothetical protein [Nitrospinaceae bacterium]NIU45460.1 hypothetical protein [Nitrospinaceae bacterium]NIU97613.1 hypothetical protein [Nitrospinaceae bacterium]